MKKLLGAAFLAFTVLTPSAYAQNVSKETYCKSVSELDDSLNNLGEISKTAPMSELRARFQSVTEDLDKVTEQGDAISQDSKTKLDNARMELIKAIRAVPDNVTVERGKQMVDPQIKNLKKARDAHQKSLRCD